MSVAITLISLLLAGQDASLAPATGVAATASSKSASPARAKPKLICEEDTETGSRLAKKKTCMTAEEWRAYRFENRSQLNRVQPMGSSGG